MKFSKMLMGEKKKKRDSAGGGVFT